jgi:hypothetical protein
VRSDGRGQVSGDKFRARPGQPFGTASDYAPTNKDLSSQIGSLSAQVTGQATILGQRIDGLEEKMDERFTVLQSEMLLLRTVTADHVPRIAAVEKTTVGKIKGVAGWVGGLSLCLTIAAQVASAFKPSLVGPIEAIGQMLSGLQ